MFAAQVRALQEEAQGELDAAMPALESALAALDNLSKADITEMKAMQRPPEPVMKVCPV